MEPFHFIYPKDGSVISIPKMIDGKRSYVVCQVAHTSATNLFWHLDNSFIGTTSDIHKMHIQPSLGYHTITVVDNFGYQETISIIVK